MGLWRTDGSPDIVQKTRPNNNNKKRTCKIVDFAVPADYNKSERMWNEG